MFWCRLSDTVQIIIQQFDIIVMKCMWHKRVSVRVEGLNLRGPFRRVQSPILKYVVCFILHAIDELVILKVYLFVGWGFVMLNLNVHFCFLRAFEGWVKHFVYKNKSSVRQYLLGKSPPMLSQLSSCQRSSCIDKLTVVISYCSQYLHSKPLFHQSPARHGDCMVTG